MSGGESDQTVHLGRKSESKDTPQSIGEYRVLRLCGQGGMGQVYACRDDALDREVAVKVMLPALAQQPDMAERFLREARSMAKVKSPYVVMVYHVGTDRGLPYLVMELLDGEDLAACLRRGPLSVGTALGYVRDAVAGLADAAEVGLVHRDVKPANLLVVAGHIKLTDFGLARPVDGSADLTQAGMLVGSPHYLAPELARGQPGTFSSDIYALGATFYEMLTGHKLFDGGRPMEVIAAHLKEKPTPVGTLRPELPRELQELVHKMLAKRPEQRYASYPELQRALEDIASRLSAEDETLIGPPAALQPPPLPTKDKAVPAAERRRPKWIGLAAIAAAVAAVVFFAWSGDDRVRRIDRGEAKQVLAELSRVPESELTARDALIRGHALAALGQRGKALQAYASAAAGGELDDRCLGFLVDGLTQESADQELELLAAWPSRQVESRLRPLLQDDDWWRRHHALDILQRRSSLGDMDLQALAILDLETGASCPKRRMGLKMLGREARDDAALSALHRASQRMPDNLCMLLDFNGVEAQVKSRLKP